MADQPAPIPLTDIEQKCPDCLTPPGTRCESAPGACPYQHHAKPGKYRHKKSGRFYYVIGDGVDCTNTRDGTRVVIYIPEVGRAYYVRELAEFLNKFEPAQNAVDTEAA